MTTDTIYLTSGTKNGTRTVVLTNDFVGNSEQTFIVGAYRVLVLGAWVTTVKSFALTFDTSSIGAGATVTAASLHITKGTGLTSSTRTWELLTKQNAITGDVDLPGDFTPFDSGANQIWTGTFADSPEDISFDASYINTTGRTDFRGNKTIGWSPSNGEIVLRDYNAYDNSSTANYLTITYTPAAKGIMITKKFWGDQ